MNVVNPIRDKKQLKAMCVELNKMGSRNYLMFALGIHAGLRISDVLPLKVGDVRNTDTIRVKEKKTGKTQIVTLNQHVCDLIADYIGTMADEEYLFASRKGGAPITRVQAYRVLNSAAEKVGITEPIGTHTLRKTFGYWLYKQTGDIAIVQQELNHSAPSITLRYIGESDEKRAAIRKSFNLLDD